MNRTSPTEALPPSSFPWPAAQGDASAAVRAFNWSAGPLGPCARWSPELRAITELLLACAFPMVVLWGPELIQIYNDGYGVILGARLATAMGQPTRDCWPEVWLFNEPIYRRVLGGETLRFDDQLFPITRDGVLEQAHFTLCYSPVRSDGIIAGVLVTVFETTVQVAAQARRAAAEQDARGMAESMPQLTWTPNAAGGLTGSSQRWLDLTGTALERNFAGGWAQVPHPDDLDRLEASSRRSIATGGAFDETVRIPNASGEYGWMRARVLPLLDTDGSILRWYGTVEDVDDLVTSVRALQSSEEAFRMAQEGGAIVTWEWDLTANRVRWSGNTALLYDASPEQLADLDSIFSRVHPDDRIRVAAATRAAREGTGEFLAEFRVLWPDGSTHWLEGRGKPVLDGKTPGGKPLRIIGVNLDLTERKQAEAALLQSEKLAAVGRLASSIAHEINNPLESMVNLFYLIGSDQDLTPKSRRYLEMAEAELNRASRITAQTLTFQRQTTRPTEVDIAALLDSILDFYQTRRRNSGIGIHRRYRRPVKLLCSEGDIRQVLNNLIGNAFDAMSSGGELLLRARAATDWKTGRRGIRITVADSGEGMTPETQKRLFDAFYTTKGASGNGLGLWVSKGIVDHHNGRIRLKSGQRADRHGTAFSLFLPHIGAGAISSEPQILPESTVIQ